MAEVLLNTERMIGAFGLVSTEAKYTIDNAKAKITIIDNKKIAFDESIKNIDQDLLTTIKKTNDTLTEVKNQYENRIDGQESRSDLFWRVVGISTGTGGGGGSTTTQIQLRCTKLAASYSKVENTLGTATGAPVGFQTNMLMKLSSSSVSTPVIEYVNMGDGDQLVSEGSTWDAYLEPDNLHGLKLYREPYDRDVFDLSVYSGIGTIAAGGRQIYLFTTQVNTGIKVGDIVTTDGGNQPFAGSSGNIVTGVSSTTKDLTAYSDVVNLPSGYVPPSIIPLITVEDAAVGEAQAPNSAGDFTTFDFSKNPNLLSDEYALPVESNPYVPQTISIMDVEDVGTGIRIEYDNSGIPSSKQDWNKFLEGFPDPDLLPGEIVPVEEPKVGAGKIYYPIGFAEKPTSNLGGDAQEGDEITIQGSILGTTIYSSLPSPDNTALNQAISARDSAEAALSGDTEFTEKITLANTIRTKRTELDLAIWAYRTHIGDSDLRIFKNDEFAEIIDESKYKDLMNGTD